jgi:hypothetical protein
MVSRKITKRGVFPVYGLRKAILMTYPIATTCRVVCTLIIKEKRQQARIGFGNTFTDEIKKVRLM